MQRFTTYCPYYMCCRQEITEKLQSMMQAHCNETLRLLQVGGQALTTPFLITQVRNYLKQVSNTLLVEYIEKISLFLYATRFCILSCNIIYRSPLLRMYNLQCPVLQIWFPCQLSLYP